MNFIVGMITILLTPLTILFWIYEQVSKVGKEVIEEIIDQK